MTKLLPSLQKFLSRDDASAFVAERLEQAIRSAIASRGQALILLSGGNTPRNAYAALAARDLQWDKVTIGLVDDRCVAEDSPGSNQAMIKRSFSQGPASRADIVDLINLDSRGRADLEGAKARMAALPAAADICLMGMGGDGHTASWFPGSRGLEAALDIDNTDSAAFIDAKGCPVAGDYPHRITLTLPAIMRSKQILLFITGQEKADVFTAAFSKSVYSAPVKALFSAGPRFHTVWAP